jgi:hypothetical protein
MRTRVRCSILVLPLAALACGDDDDSTSRADAAPPVIDAAPPTCPDGEPSDEATGNNSGIVTGPGIGSNEEPVELLRKSIEANLTAATQLEVGRAWAVRFAAASRQVAVIIEIVNPTAELVCRVAADHEWLDDDGQVVRPTLRGWVIGSVGLAEPVFAATCIAPGATAYLVERDLGELLFERVAAVDLELSFTTEGTLTPEADIVPTRYTLEEDGRYRFTFMNVTGSSATIPGDAFHHVLLLDDDGLPLHAELSDDDRTPEDGVMSPGALASVAFDLEYSGCASAAHLFIEFVP